MAKHARVRTTEQQERLERNRATLMAALSGASDESSPSTQTSGLRISLERFVINRASDRTVPYEGSHGVARVLAELARTYPEGQIVVDGHLVGVAGSLLMEGREQPVEVRATLGVGAQLALEVGPADSLAALLDAIHVFDRHFHLAVKALGRDYALVAQGYNPYVSSPSDIVPVPLSRNVLRNAYLSRTGAYARDALRCTAGTVLMLPVRTPAAEAARDYRICATLAPLLAFLTDNSIRLRGSDPVSTPRMVRSMVWEQVDPRRCGLVPGACGGGFGFVAYERWLEGTRPILFTSDEGVTFSTGTDTCERLMEDRELSEAEATLLLRSVLPDVRWTGSLELRMADALPVRQACGYAALAKGLLADDATRTAVEELVGLDSVDDGAVANAWAALREQGWEARIYGHPAFQVAHELAAIASRGLADQAERRLLDELAQLWEVRYVPRDTLLANWASEHEKSGDERAVELYGEGAVIPYDELGGEPPAGQTAVMPVLRP